MVPFAPPDSHTIVKGIEFMGSGPEAGARPTESLGQTVARIMSEADEWQRVMSLPAEKRLDVYLDMKSPHAYIAVRPTLEVARDYRIKVNFLPYTLSYTGMGISTSVELDMKRRAPSASADRRARMYYAPAREYTRLQGIPLRSPYRLLDASLAHRAFMFAKAQRLEVPFFMSICLQGWGSGWRDYEIESQEMLRGTLLQLGADVDGFEDFVAPEGAGEQQVQQCMANADGDWMVGVPHYVFDDAAAGRKLGLFGREHLTLIRGKFAGEGLARHDRALVEFPHAWRGPGTNQQAR